LIAKLSRQQQITDIEIVPTRAAHLAMMPHCREGAMSVSQTNFLDHVGKARCLVFDRRRQSSYLTFFATASSTQS